MSDLVKDLPAEYRTPSLESLPKALQPMVVKQIRKKFGLKEKKSPERAFDNLYGNMLAFYEPPLYNSYMVCIKYESPFGIAEQLFSFALPFDHEDIPIEIAKYAEKAAISHLQERHGHTLRIISVRVRNG